MIDERFKNNKTNEVYVVLDIVIDATNGHENASMVLYRKMDGMRKYVRRLSEFKEKFTAVPRPTAFAIGDSVYYNRQLYTVTNNRIDACGQIGLQAYGMPGNTFYVNPEKLKLWQGTPEVWECVANESELRPDDEVMVINPNPGAFIPVEYAAKFENGYWIIPETYHASRPLSVWLDSGWTLQRKVKP